MLFAYPIEGNVNNVQPPTHIRQAWPVLFLTATLNAILNIARGLHNTHSNDITRRLTGLQGQPKEFEESINR